MDPNREKLFDYADDKQFIGKTAPEIFAGIFKENIWKNEESVSGKGSSLEQAKEIIVSLPAVLANLDIKSFLDVPCGDFNWIQKIDFSGIIYSGADIVPDIVEANNKNYGTGNRRFLNLNLITDNFEKHDLVFCRDCLVHFSYEDIFSSIANIKKSGSVYFMTTTFTAQERNKDIHTGGWRPLNFEKAPFGFPKPLFLLNEKCTEMNGEFVDKSLGLWKISSL